MVQHYIWKQDRKKGKLLFTFEEIDSEELSEDNLKCYDIRSIESQDGEYSKKDGSLSDRLIVSFFGYLNDTLKQKQIKQEKIDKRNAEFKAKRQRDIARANKEWEEALIVKKNIKIIKDKFNFILQHQNDVDFVATNLIDLCNTLFKLFPKEKQYNTYFNKLLAKAQSASTENEKKNILYNRSFNTLKYKINNKLFYKYEDTIERAKTRFENARDGYAISFN